MIPVETTPGIRGGGSKRMVEEVNSCMIYLIPCNDLCKCHNVPPPITTIEEFQGEGNRSCGRGKCGALSSYV
jgi:hypothetical protein